MNLNFDTKYNYVFYNIAGDYLEPVFGVLNNHDSIKTFDLAFDANKIIQKVFFYHWSAKLNSKFNMPLKNIWFSKMFKVDFDNDKPTCYVFLGSKYISQNSGIYKYIKGLNPENKVVVFFFDLISKRNIDIEKLRKCTDYLVSYDESEAKKYNIHYHETVGYEPVVSVTTPNEFEYDVFFLGYAKDRLAEIHDAYNYLVSNNLKCKFVVCGVNEQDKLDDSNIEYSNPVCYKKYLDYVCKSRCVLEIIQGVSTAATLRVAETQALKRKLLSNNMFLCKQPYYNDKTMSCFSNEGEIDLDFVKSPIDYDAFDTDYYDPNKLIKYFEELLCGGME